MKNSIPPINFHLLLLSRLKNKQNEAIIFTKMLLTDVDFIYLYTVVTNLIFLHK